MTARFVEVELEVQADDNVEMFTSFLNVNNIKFAVVLQVGSNDFGIMYSSSETENYNSVERFTSGTEARDFLKRVLNPESLPVINTYTGTGRPADLL